MGRRIVTTNLQSTPKASKHLFRWQESIENENRQERRSPRSEETSEATIDNYTDRLIKYIPSDIVGAWVVASGLIKGASDIPQNTLLWIVFAVSVILTPLWILKQTAQRNLPPAKTQAIISTGAFIVWVIALGEPFSSLPFYRPVYGSLILLFYVLIVALISPPEG